MPPSDELVVLLTPDGRPSGTARKVDVHGARTPYHLAFSCYVFGPDDRFLVTRRAATKRTWPGVWTNSCCGHPAPGESGEEAVRRRLRFELGLAAVALELALPDFSYRASMGGVEEHELCPVWLARASADPTPEPSEVDDWAWTAWPAFVDRARSSDSDLSPWAREQVALLVPLVPEFLARSAA